MSLPPVSSRKRDASIEERVAERRSADRASARAPQQAYGRPFGWRFRLPAFKLCGFRDRGPRVTLLSRRKLLENALRGAAGAWLGSMTLGRSAHAQLRAARLQPAGGAPLDLGGGMHVLRAGATNVLAVIDADGVALVDGGASTESTALLESVAELSGGKTVHTLFNTHWHPDHTGSNEPLGAAGATIVSHVNTKLWLTTDVTWPWNGETVLPLPKSALPTRTFYTEDELEVGGRTVRCGHLRDCPHTDGDIYVYFPDENVMAVGDAVRGDGWPEIDWWTGGWLGGIVGGLGTLFSGLDPVLF
nr:hypothetical protein [Gammaproteobacteria bacterium]